MVAAPGRGLREVPAAPRVRRAVTARPVPAVLAAPTMLVRRGHVAPLDPPVARGATVMHPGTAHRARVDGATTLVLRAVHRAEPVRVARPPTTVVLVARVRMVDPIVLVARVPMVHVPVDPPTTIAALAARVPMVRAAGRVGPTTTGALAAPVPMVRAVVPGVTIGPATDGPAPAPEGAAVPTARRVVRRRLPSGGRPRSRRPVARR